MSVKIHDGFVIDTAFTSLHELHRLTCEFRAVIALEARRFCIHAFLRDAIAAYDRRTVGLPVASDGSPCSYAGQAMGDAHRQIRQGNRHPRYDASFELSFFPHPDGRILGIAHSERTDWKSLWQSKPGIGEYCYWNNADRPDHLSEETWRLREEDWRTVLLKHGNGIPAEAGFCTTIHNEGRTPDPDKLSEADVRSATASRMERARRIAGESVLSTQPVAELSVGDILRALAMAEADGRAEAEATRIASLLDPEPTLAVLRRAP